MQKILTLSMILIIGLVSCKNSEKEIDNIVIAKRYFNALDTSDYSDINTWCSDTLIKKEGDYNERFSQSAYLELLKWDSVFEPSYKTLVIKQQDGSVIAKISKIDKRIAFLQEEPLITHQVLKFQNDKISTIEIDYVNFNNSAWERNKSGLLSWIDEHHPELNGFIHEQTEASSIKFLKAIELYKERE